MTDVHTKQILIPGRGDYTMESSYHICPSILDSDRNDIPPD